MTQSEGQLVVIRSLCCRVRVGGFGTIRIGCCFAYSTKINLLRVDLQRSAFCIIAIYIGSYRKISDDSDRGAFAQVLCAKFTLLAPSGHSIECRDIVTFAVLLARAGRDGEGCAAGIANLRDGRITGQTTSNNDVIDVH